MPDQGWWKMKTSPSIRLFINDWQGFCPIKKWKGGGAASFPLYSMVMKPIFLLLFLLPQLVQAQKSRFIFRAGVEYRFFPIDIEDVPSGGYSSNSLPDDEKFWKTPSIQLEAGTAITRNSTISFQLTGRYNHLHWLQGMNYVNPPYERAARKNLKLDLYAIIEQKFPLDKKGNQSLFSSLGFGFTNLNTKYSVFLQDTLPSGPTQGKLYEGDFTHFGLQLRVGYQYKTLRFSYFAHLIEGPDRTGLASLWMGIGLAHEIRSQKERSN